MTRQPLDSGWTQRTFPGETICGDQAALFEGGGGCWMVIADGLGHGPRAHAAAAKAVSMVEHVAASGARLGDLPVGTTLTTPQITLPALFSNIHDSLKETVGAAVGIAHVDVTDGTVRVAGVGNVLIRRYGSAETHVVCRDGFLGQPDRRFSGPRPAEFRLAPGDLLLLASDGIQGDFTIESYPGMLNDPAVLVAWTLVERFGTAHDDVTCLAVRYVP